MITELPPRSQSTVLNEAPLHMLQSSGTERELQHESAHVVKSRVNTASFRIAPFHPPTVDKKEHDERMVEIYEAPLCSWTEDTHWQILQSEEGADLQTYNFYDEIIWTPRARPAKDRYLYKDVIAIVPDQEEVEAMREAAARDATGEGSDDDSTSESSSSSSEESDDESDEGEEND